MDTCLSCKGHVEEKRVTHLQAYHDQWYIVENLPALVCRQCGERFFTAQVYDVLHRLVVGGAEPVRIVEVPVLDASQTEES
ncbi:MAG: YgiT-type zinc finger protein [Chloroflexi bacterium]|nr:YgiT-type zinc finger protein [Chloroflexota bacterium]